MAQEPTTTTAPEAGEERREMKLRIDETDMQSAYCNTFRADAQVDEVVLDLGMNRLVPGRQDEMVFKVRNQVVMNWRNTKRLALTLANMVRQHEERFGEIELQQGATPVKTDS